MSGFDSRSTWHDPWVTRALLLRPWTDAERFLVAALKPHALHLGEVAEAVNRSVLDLQAEFGIGPPEQVARYREIIQAGINQETCP